MANIETNQVLQRLMNLKIVESPGQPDHETGKGESCSEDVKKPQVAATPNANSTAYLTEFKKRRKMKVNRVYCYEMDEHFIRARKSLNF